MTKHLPWKILRTVAAWRRLGAGLALLFAWGFAGGAHAHKVNVFAYLEGDRAYVQGYFLDGRKAKNSAITVYSESGTRLTEGRTNDEGEFAFVIPPDQGARVVLDAGEGHQAEYRFTANELKGAAVPASPAGGVPPSMTEATEAGASSDAIETAMRRAVAEGVRPLARELAELKERRAVSDIVGGLGFIVGIFGVFAYLKARKAS